MAAGKGNSRRNVDERTASFFILFDLVLFLYCPTVFELDRGSTLTQFYPTAWAAKDAATSHIGAFAQTVDGYL